MWTRRELIDRWLSGERAAAFELALRIGPSQMADLAAEGLLVCSSVLATPPPAVTAVAEVARRDWRLGHDAFDAVRDLTLLAEASSLNPKDPQCLLLYTAENAAKVIYNASDPEDPFDADSGAWLLIAMWEFKQSLGVADQEQVAERLVGVVMSALASAPTEDPERRILEDPERG